MGRLPERNRPSILDTLREDLDTQHYPAAYSPAALALPERVSHLRFMFAGWSGGAEWL
jgi:hypothetical protein